MPMEFERQRELQEMCITWRQAGRLTPGTVCFLGDSLMKGMKTVYPCSRAAPDPEACSLGA